MTAETSGVRDPGGIEVVRSEERLVAGVERLPRGVVRVGKRVVTEERTVTVTVRREELVVEHLPAAAHPGGTGAAAGSAAYGSDAVVTLVLSEEVPEVSVRAVPRERVRVYVDRITSQESVTAEVAQERVDVDVENLPRR